MSRFSIFLTLFLGFFLFSNVSSYAQTAEAYYLVDVKGKKTSWKKMIQNMQKSEVVFFGEEHNCTMSHWLTLQLMKEWTKTDSLNKSFALEMFERDQQPTLDSLMLKQFPLEDLSKHTRTWSNYLSDYAGFLQLSLQKNLRIVSSNIPRKYASKLFKEGRDSLLALGEMEKKWMCPLDFPVDRTLSQYEQLIEMEQHMSGKNFVEAQAIKDATMAESIAKELQAGRKVFHLNGKYHSDFKQSILWYLNKYRPNTKTMTISVIRQNNHVLPDEWKGVADYIFIIPEDFPVSYQE